MKWTHWTEEQCKGRYLMYGDKSVAADQIKRACQNYWGTHVPPAPPHATAL